MSESGQLSVLFGLGLAVLCCAAAVIDKELRAVFEGAKASSGNGPLFVVEQPA